MGQRWPRQLTAAIISIDTMSNLQVFLLLVCVSCVVCQTFQYSRGWTNGRKRSDPFQQPLPQPLGAVDFFRLPTDLTSEEVVVVPRSMIGRIKPAAAAAAADESAESPRSSVIQFPQRTFP